MKTPFSPFSHFFLLLTALSFFAATQPCWVIGQTGSDQAEEPRYPSPTISEPTPEEKEADWLEFYYQNPTPERFVRQMKDWSKDGTLANESARPALIGFLSQLIRQNRDQLKQWYQDLSGFTPEEKTILHTAMLYSRTKEADELLKAMFGAQYEEQKKITPKILELPLDKETTVDLVWGFFYATGSEQALRRLILCFRFLDAPDKPDGVDVPEGYLPYYKHLPEAAYVSLISNIERHPDILATCERIYAGDDSLVPTEKRELYDLMALFLPEKYPPDQNPNQAKAEPKTTPAQEEKEKSGKE